EPEPEPAPAPEEASQSAEDPNSGGSEEPQPDEGSNEYVPEPQPDNGGAMASLADKKKFVPLIVMGVVGLTFLVLMIAVLAGA
ncbi:FHA domain-containing protein, partial [Corallococcus sp. CA031C]